MKRATLSGVEPRGRESRNANHSHIIRYAEIVRKRRFKNTFAPNCGNDYFTPHMVWRWGYMFMDHAPEDIRIAMRDCLALDSFRYCALCRSVKPRSRGFGELVGSCCIYCQKDYKSDTRGALPAGGRDRARDGPGTGSGSPFG